MTGVWRCADCRLTSDPTDASEAAVLAGVHDRIHHRGTPTATVHVTVRVTAGAR